MKSFNLIKTTHDTHEPVATNRHDYPAKGSGIPQVYWTGYIHTFCFLVWLWRTWERVTAWFGAIPMQLCLISCAIFPDDQPTEQHTAIHTCTKAHTQVKKQKHDHQCVSNEYMQSKNNTFHLDTSTLPKFSDMSSKTASIGP